MSIRDFKLKWVHGMCHGHPTFVSDKKILIPCNFYMKTQDLLVDHVSYHFEPRIQISSCCSLPELGIVAVSERKTSGAIYILENPKLSKVSVLEQTDNEPYSAMQFMGLEFLVSLHIKNSYDVDLWKWQSGEKMHSLSIPVTSSEVPEVGLFLNPLWWHQCFLRSNARLVLFEVKYFEDKCSLGASNYSFCIDEEGRINMSVTKDCSDHTDFQNDVINPLLECVTIQSFCWFPENDFLVATSKGIFKVKHSDFTIHKLSDSKLGLTSMTLSKYGLFIGYKSGYVDIVNVVGHRWHLSETIKINQPIDKLSLSPDYTYLIVTTLRGSIYHLQICKNVSDVKPFHTSEFSADIAAGFLGPSTKHCVAAKKNGLVKLFRTFDGSILSTFQLDEEITSLAVSPLCSCVVIGTNSGFIYFIDTTDVHKPRIIYCEKSYDIPVDHLKFDNFGRYLFASAGNQPIKMWKGLPSSGFRMLGATIVSFQVKDIAAFCRSENSETVLLILAESAPVSDKQAGNVLIRLKLPLDFGSDPQKYQIDIFGTLSGDALNFQKRKLDSFLCHMNIHFNMGALFYCLSIYKVQKYSIWSDFPNVKHSDILTVKNVNCMRIPSSQHWIAVADLYGHVSFYSSKDLSLVASTDKVYSSDSICNSLIEFSLSNDLICCRENGITLSYEWSDGSNILKSIPEWAVFSCLQSEKENHSLHSAEEEVRLNVSLQDTGKKCSKNALLSEACEAFKMWIHTLNFKLNPLLENSKIHAEENSSTFNFNALEALSQHNRLSLSKIVADNSFVKEISKQAKKKSVVKSLSSINFDFVVENYPSEVIEVDTVRVEKLKSDTAKRVARKPISNWSFSKSVKMGCKEEMLTVIVDLFNEICCLKNKFNDEFKDLHGTKESVSDYLDDVYSKARQLTEDLPSKAERDFWGAAVIEKNVRRNFESIEAISFSDKHHVSNKSSKSSENIIEETKNNIESHLKSAEKKRLDFDCSVESLGLKKRYCDYKIYRFEVKIHGTLLYIKEGEEYSNWNDEIENEKTSTKDLRKDVDEMSKLYLDLGRSIKHACSEYQKKERTKSGKIFSKCKKLNIPEEMRILLSRQPPMQLDYKSQNPFWPSSLIINDNYLTSLSKESLFEDTHEKTFDKKRYDSIFSKQIFVFKTGVIVRNLQTQLLSITSAKHTLADASFKLEFSFKMLQNASRSMAILMSKFQLAFCSLLKEHLESGDLKLEGDLKSTETEFFSSSNVPTPDHKIWKYIDREAYRITNLEHLLKEIEQCFEHLSELRSEILSKSKDIRLECAGIVSRFKDELGENKRNFQMTKSVANEHLKESKRKVFKNIHV